MKFIVVFFIFMGVAGFYSTSASGQSVSGVEAVSHKRADPFVKNKAFTHIVVWQYKLKQKMSAMIRDVHDTGNKSLLFVLLGLAFLYGAVHALGPGHGKFVITSYALAHKISIVEGMLIGLGIAIVHTLSGVLGVLGLRYIIQVSFNQSLAVVTTVTQVVSYGLIIVLGLWVLFHKGWCGCSDRDDRISKGRNGWPWVVAAGIVPCPGVIMILLFCLSMDAFLLGLILTVSVSLGMAVTISFAAIMVVMGKSGILKLIPEDRMLLIERVLSILFGSALVVLGAVFLLAALK